MHKDSNKQSQIGSLQLKWKQMIGSVELQAKEKDDNVKARQIEQRNRKLVNMFLGKECVN